MKTFVFDFYNLYIPKGKQYVNSKLGIRIKPLKFAEEFESKRKTYSKPYYTGGWRTAKCFISAQNADEAKMLATWLEFIYTFAQSRSVFFLRTYEYSKGKTHWSFESKFIEPRENRFSVLIKGIHVRGWLYTSDISIFVNTALEKLSNSSEDERKRILALMHTLSISNSEMPLELSFLSCWIALEKLANAHYSQNKQNMSNLTKKKRTAIKIQIKKTLKSLLESGELDKDQFATLSENMDKNYLYELSSRKKMLEYFKEIKLNFERKGFTILLSELIEVRGNLVHHLQSKKLDKDAQLLPCLQTIAETTVFRLLGVSYEEQKKYLLHQYLVTGKLEYYEPTISKP